MIETAILNVIGTTMVLGAIAFVLAIVQHEWTQSRKRVKAGEEIDQYILLADTAAKIAREEEDRDLTHDELMEIKAKFSELCPTAAELGMYVNQIKMKSE